MSGDRRLQGAHWLLGIAMVLVAVAMNGVQGLRVVIALPALYIACTLMRVSRKLTEALAQYAKERGQNNGIDQLYVSTTERQNKQNAENRNDDAIQAHDQSSELLAVMNVGGAVSVSDS